MGSASFPRCIPALLLLAIAAGCGDHEPATPSGPPHVVLEVTSAQGQTTLRPLPADLAPTFQDGERRAWSLAALFGERAPGAGARVEAAQADGTRVDVDRPFRAGADGVWILRANRRGEAQLELVDRSAPFPPYHGRGGNRGRPGAEGVRIAGVVRLSLLLGAASARPAAGEDDLRRVTAMQVRVRIDGVELAMAEEALSRVEPLAVLGDSDQGTRDAWPLRALVRALAGPEARLVAVTGVDAVEQGVSEAAWRDPARVPVLRLNRRGRFKFHWADARLAPLAGDEVRDVTQLRILTK